MWSKLIQTSPLWHLSLWDVKPHHAVNCPPYLVIAVSSLFILLLEESISSDGFWYFTPKRQWHVVQIAWFLLLASFTQNLGI